MANPEPKINSIFDVSNDFLGQLRLWLEQNPPSVSITSVLGFAQFTANAATLDTEQAITAAAWTTAGGPKLTGLPNGNYVVIFGCSVNGDAASGGSAGEAAVLVNGGAVTKFLESQTQAIYVGCARADTVTLSNAGSNTLEVVYQTTIAGHTSQFRYRWLVALKYANL